MSESDASWAARILTDMVAHHAGDVKFLISRLQVTAIGKLLEERDRLLEKEKCGKCRAHLPEQKCPVCTSPTLREVYELAAKRGGKIVSSEIAEVFELSAAAASNRCAALVSAGSMTKKRIQDGSGITYLYEIPKQTTITTEAKR